MVNSTLSLTNWQVAPTIAPTDNGQQMRGDNLTIADLQARCAAYDDYKVDYEIRAADFRLLHDGRFTCGSDDDQRYHLEDPALVQMCARYGKPFYDGALPRDYTKALIQNHPAEYAPILNSHAATYGKNVFLRTYSDHVRAFMSDRFTHIDNRDVLGILDEFLGSKSSPNDGSRASPNDGSRASPNDGSRASPNDGSRASPNDNSSKNGGRYTLVRPYVGRDEMNVRVMLQTVRPPGSDSPYGVGCVIRTGEIGNVSPAVLPFIQRGVCTNSTVWEEGGIKLKQTGDRRSKLMLLIAGMGEALQSCPELINRMVSAQYEELPSLDSIINGLADKFDWSQELTFAVVHGTENQKTRAGLVNGLTYAAHSMELPAQQAIGLEMLGGKMLMADARELNQYVTVR